MQLFWPRNCLHVFHSGEECIVVGWLNDDIAVAVTALPSLEIELVTRLLDSDSLIHPKSASQLYEPFPDRRLQVLGIVNRSSNKKLEGNSAGLTIKYDGTNLEVKDPQPCLLIEFDPPNPAGMQYFTLTKSTLFYIEQPKSCLSDALEFHVSCVPANHSQWPQIIAQLNCIYELQQQLQMKADIYFPSIRKQPELIGVYSRPRSQSFSRAAKAIKNRSKVSIVSAIMGIRKLAKFGLVLLETEFFTFGNLCELLCTFQQVHLRLIQLCDLPNQYIAISKQNRQSWHWMTPERNESYTRFYNVLWLSANNWIFGVYVSKFLEANHSLICSSAPEAIEFMCDWFVLATRWLMTWPAGFKLNTQLAEFIGDVVIWIVEVWKWGASTLLTPHVWDIVVCIIAKTGVCGGVTFQLSLFIDLVTILTFPLYLLYQLLASVYNQQLNVVGGLFRVFRGKKYNNLRKRIDSGNYDMHQLLLGTILFTVVIFLLPTVLAFYGLFAITRLCLLIVSALLGTVLTFFNYFPLFPLLLRIKSPRRLPSGIQFQETQGSLRLLSQPMRVSEIFEQLTNTVNRFFRESFSRNLVWELLSGQVVQFRRSKLYRPLYVGLPSSKTALQPLKIDQDDSNDGDTSTS